VKCRVIFDSVGSKKWAGEVLTMLQSCGVEAVAALPVNFFRRGLARFDLRNHRKVAIIDGIVGYIGSQNV
jgi:cardiolipin synthase